MYDWLKGARLYARLEAFMIECIKDVARDSKLKDEARMLEFLSRCVLHVHESSWILDPLLYLNGHWVKHAQDRHGITAYSSQDLLHHLMNTLFVPEVGKNATIATFILTWRQPSLSPFLTSFVENIMCSQLSAPDLSTLRSRTTKRPVYLLPRALAQSESTRSSFLSWIWVGQHWALQIGDQEPSIMTSEERTDHHIAHPRSTRRPLVLELKRDGTYIDKSVTNSVRISHPQYHLGYTMYSDEEIMELGMCCLMIL